MPSRDAGKQLLYALRRVLRPIVRVLIRAGIPFDEFAELARGVYVESAIRDGIDQNCVSTRERVSLATGLSRQQIDYYIENEGALPFAHPTVIHVVTEVLHRWHTDPFYLGPYGIPLELEFDAPSGRSFCKLLSVVDPAAAPGVILEELMRAGSVVYSGETRLRAISRAFINPDGMSPSRIESFGSALTRFAQTLEHNFNPENAEKKRLERFVAADKGLPRDRLPAFEAHARARTEHFLAELDRWLAQYSDMGPTDRLSRVETGVNVFFYLEAPSEESPLSTLVQSRRRFHCN
ncbi:MAG TPA: DUF6502 family protein [Steroidobacteraceae bacterium]|nr:DUF6502 family protein [Steroidobacteraceae bacterium]